MVLVGDVGKSRDKFCERILSWRREDPNELRVCVCCYSFHSLRLSQWLRNCSFGGRVSVIAVRWGWCAQNRYLHICIHFNMSRDNLFNLHYRWVPRQHTIVSTNLHLFHVRILHFCGRCRWICTDNNDDGLQSLRNVKTNKRTRWRCLGSRSCMYAE